MSALYHLANFVFLPRAWKTSHLYVIKPTDGSADLSFTRAGTADRINAEGNSETMAANVPRIDWSNDVTCPALLMDDTETATLSSLPADLTDNFTIYAEVTRETISSSSITFCEFESSTTGEIRIFAHTDGRLRVKLTDNSSNIDNLYSGNNEFDQNDKIKFALRCTSTESQLYIDGALADTSSGIGIITVDNIFDLTDSRIHEMRFYPIALSVSQCQQITS